MSSSVVSTMLAARAANLKTLYCIWSLPRMTIRFASSLPFRSPCPRISIVSGMNDPPLAISYPENLSSSSSLLNTVGLGGLFGTYGEYGVVNAAALSPRVPL